MGDWIDRLMNEAPEEREKRHIQMKRRYAHLMDKPRDWLADPTRNRPAAGTDENRQQ